MSILLHFHFFSHLFPVVRLFILCGLSNSTADFPFPVLFSFPFNRPLRKTPISPTIYLKLVEEEKTWRDQNTMLPESSDWEE